MDSKVVSRAIRKHIQPLLKEQGFDTFTSRSSWRHGSDRIDVVNFQSFNSYNAEVLGCTTYSFAVNLGVYFSAIPGIVQHIKKKNGRLLPAEYDCHFRRKLLKMFNQHDYTRPDIWYIDPDGMYLDMAIKDVREVMIRSGLPWFDRFADMSEVLRILQEDDEVSGGVGWGFGTKSSPNRTYLTGYIALNLGKYDVATEALQKAIASGCYDFCQEQLKADIERAKSAAPTITTEKHG